MPQYQAGCDEKMLDNSHGENDALSVLLLLMQATIQAQICYSTQGSLAQSIDQHVRLQAHPGLVLQVAQQTDRHTGFISGLASEETFRQAGNTA